MIQPKKSQITDGLNDNSKILLEGNTGLAWKYLKEVEEDMQLLEKSLDYEYDLEFFRAVVTQNRILSEVGGIPTTFDFKGLTMDASSYVSDYSNRGNFKNHQDDFRLMWSEQASYYEGQLFTDVAGLEGISTVKGLQYAYANPQTYTTHHIDPANESVIDTLNLSSNTKANMHADVQDGNTIITPDKPVTYGSFNGTLYISLDPGKTGLYAIGEQVANGEITDSKFHASNVVLDQYFYATGKQSFNVSNIKLDKFINKEAVELVENAVGTQAKKEAFMESPIGKMANYIIKDTENEIDDIVVGAIIVDETIPYIEYVNIIPK